MLKMVEMYSISSRLVCDSPTELWLRADLKIAIRSTPLRLCRLIYFTIDGGFCVLSGQRFCKYDWHCGLRRDTVGDELGDRWGESMRGKGGNNWSLMTLFFFFIYVLSAAFIPTVSQSIGFHSPPQFYSPPLLVATALLVAIIWKWSLEENKPFIYVWGGDETER